MDVRVITLRYQEGLQGFPEEALRRAISGREVLEAREHFFRNNNIGFRLFSTLQRGQARSHPPPPVPRGGGDGHARLRAAGSPAA